MSMRDMNRIQAVQLQKPDPVLRRPSVAEGGSGKSKRTEKKERRAWLQGSANPT